MSDNVFLESVVLILLAIFRTVIAFFHIFDPKFLRRKKDIQGQKILITGAGNGVGRQLAIEFSKHAVCLILVDINKKWLLQTEKLLDRRTAVFIYDCDVSDYKKVCDMAQKVKRDVGDIDILVNNAGVVSGKYLLDIPEEKIVKTMGVNALAHIWTCKAFLPAMMEKNRGHIVNIVSLAAKAGIPRLTDYCASKFAALGFAECLEVELREQKLDGIKVTIVCTAHVDTGLFQGAEIKKLGSILTPEYVAKEVVRGVREEQETIILPYFFKYIVHLKQLVPRWLAIKFIEITGNMSGMDNFTGRLKDE